MNKNIKTIALLLICISFISAKIVNQPHGTDRSGLYGLSTDQYHAIIDRTKPVGVAKPLELFGSKANWMEGVKLSSDGKFLLSSASHKDKIIKLLDAKNGNVIKIFKGHTGDITSFAISQNSKYIVSASKNGEIILWDIKAKKLSQKITNAGYVLSIALTPNAKYAIAALKNGYIAIYDIQNAKKIKKLKAHTKDVLSVYVSKDGKYLVTGSKDKTASLWSLKNISNPKKVRTFKGHNGWVYDAILSRSGKYIITASADKTAKLWSIKTTKALRTFKGHTSYVFAVTQSKDGAYLLTASADKTLRLWDIKRGRSIREFLGHNEYVKSVAVSPDGVFAYSASTDGVIYKWVVLPNLKQTVAMCMTMITNRGGLLVSTQEGLKPKLVKGDGRKGGMIMSLESFWGRAVVDKMVYNQASKAFDAHISFENRPSADVKISIPIDDSEARYFQANIHKMTTIPIFKYDNKHISLDKIVIFYKGKKYQTIIKSQKGAHDIY